ncbi:MAG TPA: hypothetical protein VII81_02825 [Terriglobales bacterium]
MRKISLAFLLLIAAVAPLAAQVLSPAEIAEPGPQQLQEKYYEQLKQVAADIHAHSFPYPFFCSRTLDIEQQQQPSVDQRSIQFVNYEGRVAVQITGNYFASYSSTGMDRNHRARQTFTDVMLPLLKALAPRFANNEAVQAYALEVSHHVRRKVVGGNSEKAENLVLIVPRAAAEKLVAASKPEQQQGELLQGEMFLDGEPFSMWLIGDPPPGSDLPRKSASKRQRTEVMNLGPTVGAASPIEPTVNPKLLGINEAPLRIVTAEILGSLNVEHQDAIARIVRELDAQAHFVSYAPPGFIKFRRGAYLQFNLVSDLPATAAGTRYKLAALAFDDHVSHLVRPVLAYIPQNADFEGIDFATSVRLAGAPSSVAVEFMFPIKSLRCFAQYDCTGQQLLNSAVILVNGEPATIDLQRAEAER